MENWFVPYRSSSLPTARHVLVCAPHPDDEVFGCCGAMLHYRRQGAQVSVLVVTDGGAAGEDRDRVVQTREDETREALACLGLGDVTFWRLADRSLATRHDEVARRLAQVLETAAAGGQPIDVLLVPSLVEVHPDHAALGRSCALLMTRDAPQAVWPSPQVLLYEVGAALAPNVVLDITADWPQKHRAMQAFASQLALQDYARHIEGLNVFRTYTLGPDVRHAEAFRWVQPHEWAELPMDGDPLQVRAQHWQAAALQAAEAQCETFLARQAELEGRVARSEAELARRGLLLDQRQAHLEQMRAERDERQQQMEQMQAELVRRALLLDQRQDRINALHAELSSLAQAMHGCESRLAELNQAAETAQQRMQALEAEASALREAWVLEQALHRRTLDSRSWRLTRPFRWLTSRLRGAAADQRHDR